VRVLCLPQPAIKISKANIATVANLFSIFFASIFLVISV
jgi:hypothetical protein